MDRINLGVPNCIEHDAPQKNICICLPHLLVIPYGNPTSSHETNGAPIIAQWVVKSRWRRTRPTLQDSMRSPVVRAFGIGASLASSFSFSHVHLSFPQHCRNNCKNALRNLFDLVCTSKLLLLSQPLPSPQNKHKIAKCYWHRVYVSRDLTSTQALPYTTYNKNMRIQANYESTKSADESAKSNKSTAHNSKDETRTTEEYETSHQNTAGTQNDTT